VTDFTKKVPGEPLAGIRRPEWLRKTVIVLLIAMAAGILWSVFGVGVDSGLKTILLTLAAAGSLWLAYAVYCAKGTAVVLTKDGFYDDDGDMLCALSEIERVDAGLMAFRPSKGFLVRLKTPAPRGWSPGLWWRLGRRFAVGGATPGRDGKVMADLLANMIAERDGKIKKGGFHGG
jgi:hypothetical protein